ncbi:taurine ABC transporter ATP-binding protein [Anoxybacillus sp. UARK-01]|uniref:ABC transporter ATP-binding protein n=1 Tax=Anoxybacillus sp. UARK-01 TaxID=1895648 RepID=UPI0009BA274B|nr:ABC transporter ATP-binding protein [Anoxybacillus sp. UARK-01]OQM46932.1 taurine ABC transporter ATP-binding protein [Anoxybacillus sp. UARK-01]
MQTSAPTTAHSSMAHNRNPTLIELKNIRLAYSQEHHDTPILDDINLQLDVDDFVCLLGPSGCGKSSLLNILAGFQKPTAGEVMIDSQPHTGPSAKVGVVFQHHNLFPWMTIAKNIEFGLKMKGVEKSERKKLVSDYLNLVGLESSAHLLPYQLSGGMKQRAAIARTLATDPQAILMDEPFSALDALTRENMQAHLLELWQKTKKCIFFITHDVEEALLLGRRILVMHANPGRMVVDLQNPLSSYRQPIQELKHLKEFHDLRSYLISAIRNKEVNSPRLGWSR